MTNEIALSPAREADVSLLQEHLADPEQCGEFAWFGWHNPRRMAQRWEENRLLGEDYSILMVARGEERVGFVNFRRPAPPRHLHTWEMGIGLFPEARGFGYGTEAHKLLVRYLFAHTTAHRIEANTDVKNLAEGRALEKAGFAREGVTRAAIWRDGSWRDSVTYAILRTDELP
ncbi:GNAT family N-acetyltransferase [Streptomyces boninensis]|uniref:GNAT family N-acetyltransferase n=1 Tax=Streptomyces boninensis TaxID=2039455 RepID=UPI003B218AB4